MHSLYNLGKFRWWCFSSNQWQQVSISSSAPRPLPIREDRDSGYQEPPGQEGLETIFGSRMFQLQGGEAVAASSAAAAASAGAAAAGHGEVGDEATEEEESEIIGGKQKEERV